jgi:hypothetical protein
MSIQHREDMPKSGTVYRCHICRLELVVDQTTGKLDVPPVVQADRHSVPRPKRPTGRKAS